MHYCLWECVNGAASVGSSLAVSQKVKHRITTQPRNSIPKQKPKKNEDMFSLFLSLTHTLKKKSIYLKVKVIGKEAETKWDLPPTGSLLKRLQQPELAQAEPSNLELLPGLPAHCVSPSCWLIFCCFFQTSRELNGKWSIWGLFCYPHGLPALVVTCNSVPHTKVLQNFEKF